LKKQQDHWLRVVDSMARLSRELRLFMGLGLEQYKFKGVASPWGSTRSHGPLRAWAVTASATGPASHLGTRPTTASLMGLPVPTALQSRPSKEKLSSLSRCALGPSVRF